MKKNIFLVICFACCFVCACQTNEKSTKQVNKEIIKETNATKADYSKIEEKAGAENKNTYNYLLYQEDKNISLYFSINVSMLNIRQVDLLYQDELCKENVEVSSIYDNVIKITLEEYIPAFDSIVVHDAEGEQMTFYVGEHILEDYTKKASLKEDVEYSIEEEDTKDSITFTGQVMDAYSDDYDIRIVGTKEMENYFTCTEERKGKNYSYTCKIKEEYQGKMNFSLDFAIEVVDKKDGKSYLESVSYIPMGITAEAEDVN